jgi:hypothetical protein
MNRILIAAAIAAISYFVWDHYFSRAARIERAYAACSGKLSAGMNKATAHINAQLPSGNDPSTALARGMGGSMTSMMQGMSDAMGGAMCDLIRDACQQDFDGPICQAALNNSR